MKRLSASLVALLIFALVACGDDPDPQAPETPLTIASVNDLHAAEVTESRVKLKWTCTIPNSERYSFVYEARYATSEVTDENWDEALPATFFEGERSRGTEHGKPDSLTIRLLKRDVDYFAAVRAKALSGKYRGRVSKNCTFRTPHVERLRYVRRLDVGGLGRLFDAVQLPGGRFVLNLGSRFQSSGSWTSAYVYSGGREHPKYVGRLTQVGIHTTNYYLGHSDNEFIYAFGADAESETEEPAAFIVDIDPGPVRVGSVTLLEGAWTVPGSSCRIGDVLYFDYAIDESAPGGAAEWKSVIGMIDVRDPSRPEVTRFADECSTSVWELGRLDSNLLIWNQGKDTPLELLDVSDPSQLRTLATYDPALNYKRVLILGTTVCLLTDDERLLAVDWSQPSNPVEAGEIEVGFPFADDVAAAQDLVFVVRRSSGFRCFSLADPYSPVLVNAYDIARSPSSVDVMGDTVVISDIDGSEGLRVLFMKIEDPGI